MKRDLQKAIENGRGIITEKVDMNVSEMQTFYEMATKGNSPFDALRGAFLLGVSVGYTRGKAKK